VAYRVTERTRASRSLSELDEAISEFKRNYDQFANKNSRYILIEEDLEVAFQTANKGDDIKHTAKIFRDNVLTTIQIVERKRSITEGKWTNQVGRFLTKLFPVAAIACGLTAAIAEVYLVLLALTAGGIIHAFERSSHWSWHNSAGILYCSATHGRSSKKNLAVIRISFIT
jgi:hypothetical protein